MEMGEWMWSIGLQKKTRRCDSQNVLTGIQGQYSTTRVFLNAEQKEKIQPHLVGRGEDTGKAQPHLVQRRRRTKAVLYVELEIIVWTQ
jgi:hypothetical protein